MFIKSYEAAATLTLGTDALRNERLNVTSQPRVLRAVAVVGSAAINDAEIALYIESFFVGNFRNTSTGVVSVDTSKDLIPVGPHAIPPGSKLSAIIAIAPTTNPLIIQLM